MNIVCIFPNLDIMIRRKSPIHYHVIDNASGLIATTTDSISKVCDFLCVSFQKVKKAIAENSDIIKHRIYNPDLSYHIEVETNGKIKNLREGSI